MSFHILPQIADENILSFPYRRFWRYLFVSSYFLVFMLFVALKKRIPSEYFGNCLVFFFFLIKKRSV